MRRPRLCIMREETRSSVGFLQCPDGVLNELVRREEDGVDSTRAAHGDAEAAVHVPLEELDLGPRLDLLASRVHEGILLVDALRRIDRV